MSKSRLAPLQLCVTQSASTEWQTRNSSSDLTPHAPRSSNDTSSRARESAGLRARSTWNESKESMDSDPHGFYCGDVYARFSKPFDCFLSTQAEKDETAGPYLEHVRRLSRGWHHLRYLADFMTVSTLPLRFKDLSAEERQERLNRVDISVVEYGTELRTFEIRTATELEDFLLSTSTENEPRGRLIIVQDLSTLTIERLGSAFDIEPGFFRGHIGDYVWLNTRDPQAEIPDLQAFSQKSNYFRMQYVQPRYFASKKSLELAKKQTSSWNVSRRIDHDGRFKSWSDVPGSDVGLVRSKVSFWRRPEMEKRGWLGILLVDPTVDHGFTLWSGYGNFHKPPKTGTPEADIAFPPYSGTAVQEFLFWTLNQTRAPANSVPPTPDLLPLAFFTMICSQWLIMCEYVNTRLGQIEWEIELGLSQFYSPDFDLTVKVLLTWRKRMPIYHSFVEQSIACISARYDSTSSSSPFESWSDILLNLQDILHRLEILHNRADKIMAVSMAVTAREESKKATQESHAITRVTYLAFIFVPLSFWTSFFSMSEVFPIKTYLIYAATALPISAIAVMVLIFAGRMGQWWRGIKEGRHRRLWEDIEDV